MRGNIRCAVEKVAILLATGVALAGPAYGQNAGKPEPTVKDFRYGPHERNVLDFWKAEGTQPRPLAVFIHGGGFRNGSKEQIQAPMLRELLDSGISVAALNYRFVEQAPLPAAHHDCRRALQMLRSQAAEWNIDASRIGAWGGSAGAQLCMYLAFHDDMARPDSADPIERQSTRLTAVATNGGQTTMDIEWWQQNIPGYDAPHRDFYASLGAANKEEYLRTVADISALSLISADDPPIYMSYGMSPAAAVPEGNAAQGWKVHHVAFGIALKEKMDALGIEANLAYPGAKTSYAGAADFLRRKLLGRQ
jgi:acetyl esterase